MERKARDEIREKGTTGGAMVTAIPIIGPLLAIGVAGTQIAAESAAEGRYRAYDREEEQAADRFGIDLLQLVLGRARGCGAVAVSSRWTRRCRLHGLSTHKRTLEASRVRARPRTGHPGTLGWPSAGIAFGPRRRYWRASAAISAG